MPRTNTSRKKIIEAAERAFSTTGYHHTSMDDIARDAGVAKGTLYYNFPNKAELFRYVLDDGLSYVMDAITREIETEGSPSKQVESIVHIHIGVLLEHPRITKIMFNEISGGLDDEIRGHIAALRKRYRVFFEGLIDLGVREGVVKEVNRELLINTLFDLFYSISNFAADKRDRIKRVDVERFIKILLFDGVFSRGAV